MSTYRELVYLILDEIKGTSDDFTYTEDHILFLINKYRAFALKQQYKTETNVSESNYQTVCLDLEEVPAICGEINEGGYYLKSISKVPYLLGLGSSKVYPIDYFKGDIAFISRERMKYVGFNKYLKNIIYATIAPDGYLYLKSNNPQFTYLKQVKFSSVFQDVLEVNKLQCESVDNNTDNINPGDVVCTDILDTTVPIEDALIPTVTEMILKELLGASYRGADDTNNAKDDFADLASFVHRHLKKEFTE